MAGLVGCPKGVLINFVSRSVLARVLFLYERDSIQICHSLGDAFFSMKTPPLNDELCQSSPPTRPGEDRGGSQAAVKAIEREGSGSGEERIDEDLVL